MKGGAMADYAVRSFEAMEEMLIGYHELWWRSPGSGGSPYAGDGPWHLAQREPGDIKGQYSLTLIENEAGRLLKVLKLETPRPRTSLSRDEVALRDWIEAQLDRIGESVDRRAALGGSLMLWQGQGRIGWRKLAGQIGWERTPDALRQRYKRVLCQMVCRINGVPERRALWMANGARTLDEKDSTP